MYDFLIQWLCNWTSDIEWFMFVGTWLLIRLITLPIRFILYLLGG